MAKSPRNTKGPVVKTGPTRGQNRSRNDDGRWRAKRSDSGKTRDTGKSGSNSGGSGRKRGCFITTAACEMQGLPDNCRELMVMRAYRDEVLMATTAGRLLVADYYEVAPSLAPLVRDPETAEKVWSQIKRTVGFIEAGESDSAIDCYKALVDNLAAISNQSD